MCERKRVCQREGERVREREREFGPGRERGGKCVCEREDLGDVAESVVNLLVLLVQPRLHLAHLCRSGLDYESRLTTMSRGSQPSHLVAHGLGC